MNNVKATTNLHLVPSLKYVQLQLKSSICEEVMHRDNLVTLKYTMAQVTGDGDKRVDGDSKR
jgi:hypothetical protein